MFAVMCNNARGRSRNVPRLFWDDAKDVYSYYKGGIVQKRGMEERNPLAVVDKSAIVHCAVGGGAI